MLSCQEQSAVWVCSGSSIPQKIASPREIKYLNALPRQLWSPFFVFTPFGEIFYFVVFSRTFIIIQLFKHQRKKSAFLNSQLQVTNFWSVFIRNYITYHFSSPGGEEKSLGLTIQSF